jgi:SAM-dependent methyltransferase
MAKPQVNDSWSGASAYEHFMGRWSHLIAKSFIEWLAPRPDLRWLDIGCGTGALSETILAQAAPKSILAVDPSAQFIEFAKLNLSDSRVAFHVGEALNLPQLSHGLDVAVSGLALNFIPEPVRALQAMRQALGPKGVIAFYVWDYSGKMEMLRYFWDSARALDSRARPLDEGLRFPLCQPDALRQLCEDANLQNIEVNSIEAATIFHDFDDYWSPFLGGQGPAPSYVSQLDTPGRLALEQHLRASLPFQQDGSIHLVARAWAVRIIS